MINSFRVRGYKALLDVELALTPVHVLIGPNDTGKSSILEALSALCRSVDFDLSEAFTGRWSGTQLVWRGGLGQVVELEAEFAEHGNILRYSLGCAFPLRGRDVHVVEERLVQDESSLFDRDPSFGVTFVAASARSGFEVDGDARAPSAQMVYDALQGVHSYRWNPLFLSLPVVPDARRRFRMEPNGFGLAMCLDDILGYDRERFGDLEDRFRSIFPEIKSIKLSLEQAYRHPIDDPEQVPILERADGKGVHFDLTTGARDVPASQMSDGILLVLASLTILYLPDPPRLLLVEEPENGIHPDRLKEIVAIVRDVVGDGSRTQVVMTTHSPYILDSFQPDEVTVCRKAEDGFVETRRLSASSAVRDQIDVFTLGEIWTGEGDEALFNPVEAE
jgi:hypothetical protein